MKKNIILSLALICCLITGCNGQANDNEIEQLPIDISELKKERIIEDANKTETTYPIIFFGSNSGTFEIGNVIGVVQGSKWLQVSDVEGIDNNMAVEDSPIWYENSILSLEDNIYIYDKNTKVHETNITEAKFYMPMYEENVALSLRVPSFESPDQYLFATTGEWEITNKSLPMIESGESVFIDINSDEINEEISLEIQKITSEEGEDYIDNSTLTLKSSTMDIIIPLISKKTRSEAHKVFLCELNGDENLEIIVFNTSPFDFSIDVYTFVESSYQKVLSYYRGH